MFSPQCGCVYWRYWMILWRSLLRSMRAFDAVFDGVAIKRRRPLATVHAYKHTNKHAHTTLSFAIVCCARKANYMQIFNLFRVIAKTLQILCLFFSFFFFCIKIYIISRFYVLAMHYNLRSFAHTHKHTRTTDGHNHVVGRDFHSLRASELHKHIR